MDATRYKIQGYGYPFVLVQTVKANPAMLSQLSSD